MGKLLKDGSETVTVISGSITDNGSDYGPTGIAPVTINLAASGQSASFAPKIGREVNLTLSGIWTGSAALEHQLSDGLWYQCTLNGSPLVWTGNLSEPVWVEMVYGAVLRINFTRTSGALTGRIEH